MIFHDMSVYFMIFLWFHGISWLFTSCCCHRSRWVPSQAYRGSGAVGVLDIPGHGGTPNHPKVDRSGLESHGDLGILKRNHGHPESRPGAPIGAQGVVGAFFLGANKDLLVLL